MIFKLLTKKEVKIAELATTPVWNLTNNQKNKVKVEKLKSIISRMYDWQYDGDNPRIGLETNKLRKKHISMIFGNPIYHVNYEYRTAVWGFSYKDINIIMYYSEKGFSIQLSKDCCIDDAILIVNQICKSLSK